MKLGLEQYFMEKGIEEGETVNKREIKVEEERKDLETPPPGKGLLLLSVGYSGEKRKAMLRLYDPHTGKIYIWYDTTNHKPYLLTDLTPKEIIEQYPQVYEHKGFDHFEIVEKYDALRDRKILMTKVVAKDPLSIGGGRGAIRDILPKTWESKIKYHLCYIYDRGLIPGTFYKISNGKLIPDEIKLKNEIVNLVKRLYSDPEIFRESLEWIKLFQIPIPDIKRIALDIEVYSPLPQLIPSPQAAKHEVIAVAFSSNDNFKKVFVYDRRHEFPDKTFKINNGEVTVEVYDNEKEMLQQIFKVIRQYPLVLTFNGDNFDLNYLWHRAIKLGFRKEDIPITLGRDYAQVFPGVHVDLYKFFENHAMQVYAFKNKYRETKTLDTIAQALLGIGKIKLDKAISELTLKELSEYCFRDADITLKLTTFDNNLVLKLIILMMRISKLPIEDLTRSGVSNWIKSMMYFMHRQKGYLIPEPDEIKRVKGKVSTKAIIKGKKYLGAIVIDPLPGVFFNVVVVDFASLYPSVVKRWNLSYETVNCPHEECKENKIPGLPHWVCKKHRGLSSLATMFLRDFRVEIYKPLSKRKDLDPKQREVYDTIQLALKVFINASYGVFGAETFPLYCPPVAESTTALGRYAISKTIKKAIEMGLAILYGDTDSLFLWNPPKEKVEELLNWVKSNLGIDLDIDKVYRYVAFSSRKKNYLGILEDGRLDIKGLVGKKRHTPEFLKKLFLDISMALSEIKTMENFNEIKNKIREITRNSIIKLKNKEYSLDDLAFKVALTKNLNEYTKNTPQHVKAAKMLLHYNYRIEAGSIISFVKTKGSVGVKPVQLARIDEIDEEKYFSHLETTLSQVLEAIGLSLDEIAGRKHLESFLG